MDRWYDVEIHTMPIGGLVGLMIAVVAAIGYACFSFWAFQFTTRGIPLLPVCAVGALICVVGVLLDKDTRRTLEVATAIVFGAVSAPMAVASVVSMSIG